MSAVEGRAASSSEWANHPSRALLHLTSCRTSPSPSELSQSGPTAWVRPRISGLGVWAHLCPQGCSPAVPAQHLSKKSQVSRSSGLWSRPQPHHNYPSSPAGLPESSGHPSFSPQLVADWSTTHHKAGTTWTIRWMAQTAKKRDPLPPDRL